MNAGMWIAIEVAVFIALYFGYKAAKKIVISDESETPKHYTLTFLDKGTFRLGYR